MTKKLNPMLEPDNRTQLLLEGMKNIDRLQQQTIERAKKNIDDYEAFQQQTRKQFEKSVQDYLKVTAPLKEELKRQSEPLQPDKSTQNMIDNAVKNQQEIIDYLKRHKKEFEKKYNISKMALFGSYARGENREDSDIDIAIETKLSDYFRLYDLKEELEKAFKSSVDIVRMREKMNESLRKRIMKDGIYV